MRCLLPLSLTLALAACASPASLTRAPTPAADAAPAEGALLMSDATLSAYHWDLDQATAADGSRIAALFPRPAPALRLGFSDDGISVANGCNRLGGRYRLDGTRLELAQLIQTQMACAAPLMRADTAIAGLLQDTPRLALQGSATAPVLVLTTAAGDTLHLVGTPTADTRHGGPGETVFREVAAQRMACHHPLMPDHQCLRVREVVYDDSGLRRSVGEWGPFYDEIEGYTHQPGIRNVLRLKRYARRAPIPADAPAHVYVLDMTVESARED